MIYLVAGARPNFMKVAPLIWEFKRRGFTDYSLIHTGQHYDYEMSQAFFDDLDLDSPNHYLNVGSGTHSFQTAEVMKSFEKICLERIPKRIVVVGDVNSTLAAALVGAKLNIKVAHVEAGLRSFDKSMPEEINRIVTDHISDELFVSESSGTRNLENEGINSDRVFFVGNIMIDSLIKILPKTKEYIIPKSKYALVTIHRPSNVDDISQFTRIIRLIERLSQKLPVLFFAHPRTIKQLNDRGIRYTSKDNQLFKMRLNKEVYITKPVGYIEFLYYLSNAEFVLTDSGGIQEETTYLGIPCLTLRSNTERPVTVEVGTNYIVGDDPDVVEKYVREVIEGTYKKGKIPDLWDGKTAWRISEIILK